MCAKRFCGSAIIPIMLWCARNEGFPPPEIDAALRKLMAELEPTRAINLVPRTVRVWLRCRTSAHSADY